MMAQIHDPEYSECWALAVHAWSLFLSHPDKYKATNLESDARSSSFGSLSFQLYDLSES